MRRSVAGLAGAVQFLTRVPVRTATAVEPARMAPWFAVVGAMVGALVGAVAAGVAHLTAPLAAAAVAVLVGVLVTGAFHEDGLADLADAVAGGATRVRRFEILEDPRHGTYGVAALCGSIVVRVAALASLGPAAAFAGSVAAHALGRGVAVVTMGVVPAARTDGLGAAHARRLGAGRTAAAGGAALAVTLLVAGWWAAPLAAAALAGAAAIGVVARRSLGGVTGDVLGAVEQVAEILVLVTVAALAGRDGGAPPVLWGL